MKNQGEKISVIMGIYNCASTLTEAIECIFAQTYTNWELILCDDGSKDDTYNVAKSYADRYDNVILIKNECNMGLNYTLNHCLQYAKGEYIARMDGDDLCMPDRFQKQLAVLKRHPEYGIVSCPMIYFDELGEWGFGKAIEKPVKKDFIKGTPFCHAPSLVRKELFDLVQGYSINKRLLRVEDYHLWVKMYAKGYKGINLMEHLYKMRDDRNAYTRRKFKYRINETYVRFIAAKILKLPITAYFYAFRPLIVGCIPFHIYNYIHKRKIQN